MNTYFELTGVNERLWCHTHITVVRRKVLADHIFGPLCFVLANSGHAVRHDFLTNRPARPDRSFFESRSTDGQVVRTQEKACLPRTVYGNDSAEKVDLLPGVLLRQLLECIWEHCHIVGQVSFAEWDLNRLARRAGGRFQDGKGGTKKPKYVASCQKIHLLC